MKDPYAVLGVPRDADADAIRKAYRGLARKHHPDVSDAPDAEARFKEISAAHALLSDPEKRQLYDRFGEAGLRAGGDPTRGGAGAGFGGPGFDDILESLFGGRRGPVSGQDVRMRTTVDLLTAVRGGEITVGVPQPHGPPNHLKVKVPAGLADGTRMRLRGQGRPPRGGGPCGDLLLEIAVAPHPLLRRHGDDLELDLPITVYEALTGATVTVPTPHGDVRVGVPAGARAGQRLRVKGRGVVRDDRAGDLFLVLRVAAPDPTEDPGVLAAAAALEPAYLRPVRADLTL